MSANKQTPIVLVHGLFGSLSAPEILAEFGENSIFAPDLLGYGEFRHADTVDLTLQQQADHLAALIKSNVHEPAVLVGHSVGGAVAALVAFEYPDLMAGYISVEGNFTLEDAFWSAQIAETPIAEVEQIISKYKADSDGWIANAGVEISDFTSQLARDWLDNQPASTIKAQAKAVVTATGDSCYLDRMERLFDSDLPVSLVAGARSAEGWDVPQWADEKCSNRINISETGHLMMAESPEKFAKAILSCINH